MFEPSEGIKPGNNHAQVHYFGQRSNPVKIIPCDRSQSAVIGA